jgi:hypothetical protein
MAKAGHQTTISLCNAGETPLAIWLEPWCDEFLLSPRCELSLEVDSGSDTEAEPELETSEHGLTIFARANSRTRVFIDGEQQTSGSVSITAPDFGPLSSKGFVDLVFGNFPEARPRGAPAPSKPGWFRRLFGRA